MYITGIPTMGHIASGGIPARKSGRLDPSDPEYARIRRAAASAFDDPSIAADCPAPGAQQPAGDLGDQVADLLAQRRGKPSAMAVAAATVLRDRGEHAQADALAPVPTTTAVDPLASDPAFDAQDRITIQMLRDRGQHERADKLIADIRGARS